MFLSPAIRWNSPRFTIEGAWGEMDEMIKASRYVKQRLHLSEKMDKKIKLEMEKCELGNCLGVSLRGTDYISLRPSGHAVQPDVNQAVCKIKEYLKNHDVERIFLVTEDRNIYSSMKTEFGDLIYTYGNHYIEKYEGNGLIGDCIEDANEQGKEYLIRIMLLSKCKSLIGGKNLAAQYAILFNGGAYEYKYIFELGVYE